MTPDIADIPLLRDAGKRAIEDVARSVAWYSAPAGWPIFKEGEAADALYFVKSGSLGAFRSAPDGRSEFVGHIRAGEPVGEMALIAGERHSASVYALRDTELLMLDRATFNRLIRTHPTLMQNLARTMLLRTRQTRRRNPRADPRVYALLSTSPSIDLMLRARLLKEALGRLGKRAVVVGEEGERQTSAWFDDLERWNDVVILAAPVGDTAWCKLCLRQADRIWLLARADARPSSPLLPDDTSPARQFRFVDVVLIRHGAVRQAAAALEWIEAADAARVFSWSETADRDCARLARTMAGLSVGLVLSGGGARAYAHIGAVRAIREARLPIDFVGGTSMGAVVAACVAMGWDDEEIERRIWKAFVESNPLADYILPVVSLTSGRRVDDRLEEHFGQARIEDMSLPFFCVSTNLTAGAFRVHRTGVVRHALRASIALPGILPPVVEDDAIMVDGAVLNNFPVDVMQDLHRGPNIGVDVAREHGLNAADFIDPPGFFSWVTRRGFHAPPPIAGLLIRAATVNVDPWGGREKVDLLVAPDLSGVELRDWKAYDQAVAAGYEATVASLQNLQGPLRRMMDGFG
jgi:NTE family protein